MAGIVEEGDEVMAQAKKKADTPAGLSLVGAALRVEYYEIAAYTTARNLQLQFHQAGIVDLQTISFGKRKNAGQMLDEVAQPLMSVAKMPSTVE
jgi:Mn-containing catalase